MQPRNSHSNRKLIVIFGIIAVIAIVGIALRLSAASNLRDETKDGAVATVAVIKAKAGPATEEIVLPGNVQAWHDAPIFARTNGYLKEWKTDIGTKVKTGDLLAVIETPEIDAQLRQAEADLKTAEANSEFAQSTAARWKALLQTDSVSKQEAEEKISDASAKIAALASARANRDRLHDLESFKRIVAPFAGTITARNTDNGALINAGSGTELFHIADISRLRVYIQVPQNYAGAITPDVKAELHFAELPGKVYTAKFLRSANAIDQTSRTVLMQFEADNHNNELLAGGYTQVHMKLTTQGSSVRLPVNTLIFRAEGLQVATVDANNHVQLKTVTMGRDYGNEVEIKAGIQPGEPIVINPPDSLASGQVVRIAASAPEKKDTKKP